MRIECEVCSATYTIDDAQLSDQPIGAQCPYCGHVKLVRKNAAPVSSPSVPPRAAADMGLGAQAPSLGGGYSPFGGPSGAPQPTMPPPFGSSPGAPPFIDNTGAPFPGSPSFEGSARPQSSRGAPISSDLSLEAPPFTVGPTSGGLGFGAGAGAAADGDAACQVCGTPLTDEFDKVIGLCDAHQRDRRADHDTISSELGSAAPSALWYARARDGRTAGPMSLDDLRVRIREGDFTTTDEFSRDGLDFGPIARFKEIAYLASLALSSDAGVAPRTSYPRASRPRVDATRLITPILGLVVLAGLGFLVYAQQDKIVRIYEGLTSPGVRSGPTGTNPLKRYLASWRLAHPDVSGTADEHLVTARARHLEDTWRGYQQAEKAYERALLLDEDNPEAIAGYVENLAVWRFDLATPEELKIAEAAVRYAMDVAPENPAPHRAFGALALAKGDLNGCRAGADGALQKHATDGRAKLILAGCYLEGNVQLAISEAERGRQLLPELRRADRVLGDAYTRTGRYASAFQILGERLKIDPDNAAVHLLYGNVARELAQGDKAIQHYELAAAREGDSQGAYLALAELALEQGRHSAAIGYYARAAELRAAYGERAARMYAGWAKAELLRRRAQRAQQLAEQALTYSPRNPAALLIRGEAALMAGSATTAAVFAKRALDARDGEPSALVLAARADAALRLRDQAIKRLEAAIANDPRDPRLKGILAAYYLTLGGSPQAYALMRRAAEIDPDEARSRARVGLLALSEVPVLDAIEQFRRSAADERDASVASSAMGVLYYHLGDYTRAKSAIERALRVDSANSTALIYDAQLALDRGDAATGLRQSQRLLAVERGSALGFLLNARAFRAMRRLEDAQEAYRSALRSNPGLLAAKVELAGLGLETGERDATVQALANAFSVDPNSISLRHLLLQAGI